MDRKGSTERYGQGRGGRPWRRLRARVMERDAHLCQPCKKRGRITLATECDHILPISKGGTDEEGNLQAICTDCHKVKTDREAGAKPVVGCDADGWPE